MKVGKPDPREDVRRVKAVRKAIGNDAMLMVDANQSWDLMTASIWGRKLEEFDLTWLEEPLHPDDIKAHRLLKQATSIPIALAEHIYTTQSFRDYIDNAAVDIIQVDVCRIGGIIPRQVRTAIASEVNMPTRPPAVELLS